MRSPAEHEGCEFTDPYLYSVFASDEPPSQQVSSRVSGESSSRESRDPYSVPGGEHWDECRPGEARLLFLLGLFPHF